MGFCTTIERPVAVAVLLATLAGCEPSAPASFDADGAAADAAALHEVFDTPLMHSLEFAAAEIDRATGGVVLDAAAAAPADTGSVLARRAGRIVRRSGSPVSESSASASAGELPETVAGRTFAFDPAVGSYVATDAPGAPPAGVRFLLYAVDPLSGIPAAPALELGHVDVISEGVSQVRIQVADADATRLEYRVTATGTEPDRRIHVEGFTIDGATRAEFAFENRIELTGTSSGTMHLVQALELPARNVALDCASALLVRAGLAPELQLELSLRGPNGEVDVAGAYQIGGSGSLAVAVNGDSYADVHVDGTEYDFAGAAGEPLPESAVTLLGRVIGTRESGLELFDRIVRPVETLIAP
jgi:hypothetical protein